MKEKLKILTYILTFLVKIIERCIKFILRLILIINPQMYYNIRTTENSNFFCGSWSFFFSIKLLFKHLSKCRVVVAFVIVFEFF